MLFPIWEKVSLFSFLFLGIAKGMVSVTMPFVTTKYQ